MISETGREPEVGISGEDSPLVDLVERVRAGDRSGMEDLYHTLSKGIRFLLLRQCGPQDLDDKIHDILLILTKSIQRGDLREPERLMGYVRTIAHRHIARHINKLVERRNQSELGFDVRFADRQPDPERRLIQDENKELAMRVLRSLKERDRQVLIRFYAEEQTAEQICREMGLTATQFRLIKSRAKARFGELGKARLALRKGPGRSHDLSQQAASEPRNRPTHTCVA